MPFIIPEKLHKMSNRDRFSKYKHLDQSQYFIMQERRAPFRSERKPDYRIITQRYPYYELATGDDLADLKNNEWSYMKNYMPELIPKECNRSRLRSLWMVSHFTQLALENGASNRPIDAKDPFSNADTKDQQDSYGSSDGEYSDFESGGGRDPLEFGSSRAKDIHFPKWSSNSQQESVYSDFKKKARAARRERQRKHGGATPVQTQLDGLREQTMDMLLSESSAASPQRVVLDIQGRRTGTLIVVVSVVFLFIVREAAVHIFTAILLLVVGLVWWSVGRDSSDFKLCLVLPANTQQRERSSDWSLNHSAGHREEDDSMHFPRSSSEVSPGVKVKLGHSMTHRQSGSEHLGTNTWSELAGPFLVRCGPHYKRNKTKTQSAEPFYRVFAVEVFSSESKVSHIAQYLDLPTGAPEHTCSLACNPGPPPHVGQHDVADEDALPSTFNTKLGGSGVDSDTDLEAEHRRRLRCEPSGQPDWHHGCPPKVILNFQIPAYSPGMIPVFGKKDEVKNGVGWSVVVCLSIKESTKQQLLLPETQREAALNLLLRFFQNKEQKDLRKRFKVIPSVVNSDSEQLGRGSKSMLATYNNRPFMTGPRGHSFYEGDDYLEIDVDVHSFGYLARKTADCMLGDLPAAVIDLGFLVEGQGNEEQPERLLGAVRLAHIDYKLFPSLAEAVS